GGSTDGPTYGISLQPEVHQGDPALVRARGHYRVGDVVAFHSATLGAVVLHRLIVLHEDGTFTTRGDNNGFDDPDRTPPTAIIGRLWIRIGHGGVALKWLGKPVLWGLGGSFALLV